MKHLSYKSFALEFNELTHTSLHKDVGSKVDKIISDGKSYWFHFEKISKNLQQQVCKKLGMPKSVRSVLFAEEVRPRCIRIEDGFVLIVQGIQPSYVDSDIDFPTLRFWVTKKGILSIATDRIDAIYDFQKNIKGETPLACFSTLLEEICVHLEDTIYKLDETLFEIESNFEYTEDATYNIMEIRQNIIYLRRYILPQRDALISLANSEILSNEASKPLFKEHSNNMIRYVESIEMLKERSMIIQDNLANQIAEIANQRVYLLSVIMLLFTPAFFIMGLFSMYIPMPGMYSNVTWWVVCGIIVIVSYTLYFSFKRKKWL